MRSVILNDTDEQNSISQIFSYKMYSYCFIGIPNNCMVTFSFFPCYVDTILDWWNVEPGRFCFMKLIDAKFVNIHEVLENCLFALFVVGAGARVEVEWVESCKLFMWWDTFLILNESFCQRHSQVLFTSTCMPRELISSLWYMLYNRGMM